MSTKILGIGTSLPTHLITQEEAFDHAKEYCGGTQRQQRALKRLYERAAISSRSTFLESEPLSDFFPTPQSVADFGPSTADRMIQYESAVTQLAVLASERAVEDVASGVGGAESARAILESVHSLVTVSCTGFSSPGFDIELINRLGLNRDVSRSHIGFMGCHGALNGLRVARALVDSNPSPGRVLLCAAEICSLHFHYGWSADSLLANSLFADGAGALILGSGSDEQAGSEASTEASKRHWGVKSSVSYLVPKSLDAMSWKIGNNGFVMSISARVPDLIKEHLRPWLENWLHSMQLEIGDIGAWAIHPGGVRILDAVGKSLDLSDSDLSVSRDLLQRSGNMSSPTVLFVLEEIRARLGCVPTVLLAFGPGLTIEAAYCSSE